jgi:hypothetical protein
MTRTLRDVPTTLEKEITQALREWVESLPPREARTPVTNVSGRDYTPVEILSEVDRHTQFGTQFVFSLYLLQERMTKLRPGTSVAALIRRSFSPSAP